MWPADVTGLLPRLPLPYSPPFLLSLSADGCRVGRQGCRADKDHHSHHRSAPRGRFKPRSAALLEKRSCAHIPAPATPHRCSPGSSAPRPQSPRLRRRKTPHRWASSLTCCVSCVVLVLGVSGRVTAPVCPHASAASAASPCLESQAANLLHKSPANQKQLLDAEGVPVFLSCFLHDDQHPLMRGAVRALYHAFFPGAAATVAGSLLAHPPHGQSGP